VIPKIEKKNALSKVIFKKLILKITLY